MIKLMETGDLYWVAGLIEGEGWIGITPGHGTLNGQPTVKVAMTDEDVVSRLHVVSGLGTFRPVSRSPGMPSHHKSQFAWTVAAEREVQALLVQVLPILGQRRTEAAWKVLDLIDRRRELRAQRAATCGNGHDQTVHGYTDGSGAHRCRECVRGYSKAAYARKKERSD